MNKISITYHFILAQNIEEVFTLHIHREHLELIREDMLVKPKWVALDFHQCPHCPLSPSDHPNCPVALNLTGIVDRFKNVLSYKQIDLYVTTKERQFFLSTTVQKGVSSLMGLLIATSGCPYTHFFKPMAYFHLPFASDEETICRATSLYLLSQFFFKKTGSKSEMSFEGLNQIYKNIHIVNTSIAERLRASTEADATVNAIVVLDMFTKAMPDIVEDDLDEIRYLFKPFLSQ